MKNKYLLLLVVTFLNIGSMQKAFSQGYKVGDVLPDSFFTRTHKALHLGTAEETSLRLADHRHKLIILYSWFAACAPCIESFIKFDKFRPSMDTSKYVVIPYTYNTTKQLERVYKKYQWEMTTIIENTDITKFLNGEKFIWIKDGKIIATPDNHFGTQENFLAAMEGMPLPFPVHNSISPLIHPDFSKQIFKDEEVLYKSKSSRIAGYVPGLVTYIGYRLEKGKDSIILYNNNLPIEKIFEMAYENDFSELVPREERIIWSIGDSLRKRILTDRKTYGTNFKEMEAATSWLNKNSYGYEGRHPATVSTAEVFKQMQVDLQAYFGRTLGVGGRLVPINLRYGVLKLTGSKEDALSLLTRGDMQALPGEMMITFTNTSFYRSLYRLLTKVPLNKFSGAAVNRPLVDSTGLGDELISAYLPESILEGWSLVAINKELRRYGLYIEIVEQSLPRLEIYEIDQKKP